MSLMSHFSKSLQRLQRTLQCCLHIQARPVLPAHIGKADERNSNRDRIETQEDVESPKFRLWKFDIDVMLNQEGFTKKDHFFRIPGQFKK